MEMSMSDVPGLSSRLPTSGRPPVNVLRAPGLCYTRVRHAWLPAGQAREPGHPGAVSARRHGYDVWTPGAEDMVATVVSPADPGWHGGMGGLARVALSAPRDGAERHPHR